MRACDLERALRGLLPLEHFILTGYGRNSLYLVIKAMGWDRDSEVIVPAFTCPVIPLTVSAAGAIPVAVDSEPEGLNIDPDGIASAITPRTKAIYVVHTYGTAARIEEICLLARERGITVIEDLAHSPFHQVKGRHLGTFGDIALLSFTKKMVNFEGAAVGTNHAGISDEIRRLQHVYQQDRPFSLADLRDCSIRIIGSWWESRFSLIPLFLLKMADLVNDVLYKGTYGFSLDKSKFTMSEWAMRLTRWQLEGLLRRGKTTRYREFRHRYGDILGIPPLHQGHGDSLPAYYSGLLEKNSRLMKTLSFRTWHNFTADSRHPRALQLFATYRLFARAILRGPGRASGFLKRTYTDSMNHPSPSSGV